MRKAISIASYLHCITLTVICQAMAVFFIIATPVNAEVDTNNFQFTSFTADYYLEKTTEASKLRVTEKLIAEFPSYNQNHGIERAIPFTNQGETNLTAPSIDSLNFSAMRDSQSENITDTSTNRDYYLFRLGDPDQYLHGDHEYRLEYEFTNVITDQAGFQELYWDTNGTGWKQPFGQLTARFHLSPELLDHLHDNTWCYVGRKDSNDQSRCTTTRTADGFTFTTTNSLASHENLTFVVNFDAGTFIVPPPRTNNIIVTLFIISLAILTIAIIAFIYYYRHYVSAKRSYYRHLFTPPQYAPHPGYTVADTSHLYHGRTKSSQVATLLELAVAHKIDLIKADKKTWKIRTHDLSNLTAAQSAVLQILAGSPITQPDYEFTIERRTYSTEDSTRASTFRTAPLHYLKQQQLIDTTYNEGAAPVIIILATVANFILTFIAVFIISESVALTCPALTIGIVIATILNFAVVALFAYFQQRYTKFTQAGLDMANYYAGLHQYIKLAEADRLKFLQSVDDADTSPQGIVKLYEQVLPYAALFGLEKSWLAALSQYYETNPDLTPDWYTGSAFFTSHDFSSFSSSTSSSYSSASSSDSGSGSGGGSSGGGGGGGGGGGW